MTKEGHWQGESDPLSDSVRERWPHFPSFISFNPENSPMGYTLLLASFYRQRHWRLRESSIQSAFPECFLCVKLTEVTHKHVQCDWMCVSVCVCI